MNRDQMKFIIQTMQQRYIDYDELAKYYKIDLMEKLTRPLTKCMGILNEGIMDEVEYWIYEAPLILKSEGELKISHSDSEGDRSYIIKTVEDYLDYLVKEGIVSE